MKTFLLLFAIVLLNSCSGFTPLYQNQGFLYEKLKDISFNTDKKKMSLSIKKYMLKKLPPKTNNINYILKIETQTDTNSTVTDSDRKTSGYEVITTSDVFLYKRKKEYDKLIYSFQEKEVTMFELSPNQVLSTLASRNKALEISSENISKSILDRLMLYFSQNNNVSK